MSVSASSHLNCTSGKGSRCEAVIVAIAGLRVSHVHDAFEESASKDAFALHCKKRNWRFQEVNPYIIPFHSLFQACRTLTDLDIIYSLLTFFIYKSRYTANTTYTPAAGARNCWLHSLGISRWLWCVACDFVFRSSESLKIRKRPREELEDSLSCFQCDESIWWKCPRIAIRGKKSWFLRKGALDPCCKTLHTAFSLAFLTG